MLAAISSGNGSGIDPEFEPASSRGWLLPSGGGERGRRPRGSVLSMTLISPAEESRTVCEKGSNDYKILITLG